MAHPTITVAALQNISDMAVERRFESTIAAIMVLNIQEEPRNLHIHFTGTNLKHRSGVGRAHPSRRKPTRKPPRFASRMAPSTLVWSNVLTHAICWRFDRCIEITKINGITTSTLLDLLAVLLPKDEGAREIHPLCRLNRAAQAPHGTPLRTLVEYLLAQGRLRDLKETMYRLSVSCGDGDPFIDKLLNEVVAHRHQPKKAA